MTKDSKRLQILDLGSIEIVLCSKNKGADQLIRVFVFAYAKSRFSHDAAHIKPVPFQSGFHSKDALFAQLLSDSFFFQFCCFVCLFVLRLNVPVNNFSVISGQKD